MTPPLSAYGKACAETCGLCRQGYVAVYQAHWLGNRSGGVPCTAPTPEQFMEEQAETNREQAARIAQLEAANHALQLNARTWTPPTAPLCDTCTRKMAEMLDEHIRYERRAAEDVVNYGTYSIVVISRLSELRRILEGKPASGVDAGHGAAE